MIPSPGKGASDDDGDVVNEKLDRDGQSIDSQRGEDLVVIILPEDRMRENYDSFLSFFHSLWLCVLPADIVAVFTCLWSRLRATRREVCLLLRLLVTGNPLGFFTTSHIVIVLQVIGFSA